MDIKELQKQIIQFRDKRNWKQFHSLKDLLIGLDIECAELSELFLWKSETEIKEIAAFKIENELADVFIFISYLSNHFNIDLERSVIEKMELNNQKYPVEKSYGRSNKYDKL